MPPEGVALEAESALLEQGSQFHTDRRESLYHMKAGRASVLLWLQPCAAGDTPLLRACCQPVQPTSEFQVPKRLSQKVRYRVTEPPASDLCGHSDTLTHSYTHTHTCTNIHLNTHRQTLSTHTCSHTPLLTHVHFYAHTDTHSQKHSF